MVAATHVLKRQAELPTPNVRASNRDVFMVLKCYFKNAVSSGVAQPKTISAEFKRGRENSRFTAHLPTI